MSRFAFQWLVPGDHDRLTHVMLLDSEQPAPSLLAVGHGPDKVRALINLYSFLIDNEASADANDYVASEFMRRTGKAPVDALDQRFA